jgi:hypothetical protein
MEESSRGAAEIAGDFAEKTRERVSRVIDSNPHTLNAFLRALLGSAFRRTAVWMRQP